MLIKAFIEQVEKRPGKIAVKAGEYTLTYSFLHVYSSRLACIILETCKAPHKEQSAVLLLGHDESMIIGIIGVLKAGMVYIPFDPTYPLERLTYMLKDSGADLIITNRANLDLALTLRNKIKRHAKVINIDAVDDIDLTGFPCILESPGNPAYILYTSGSTGKPKGVVQDQKNIFYYIRNWVERFSVAESDRMAQFASFSHDGAVPDVYSVLLNGATLYPFDVKIRANTEAPAQWLIKECITIWHSVPTWYRYFINTLTGHEVFRDLRLVVLGGEQVREHDIIMFKKYFPYSRFGNIYGQTESTVNSIWLLFPGDDFHEVLVGEPIDQTKIFVVDREGDEVNEFEVGEIVMTGHYLSPGYLNNVEAAHNVFSEDKELGRLYWSGDIGRLLPDGNIEILGRKDHQVKVRGFRIETGEIETVLVQHPDISEAVVAAREGNGGSTYGTVSGDYYLWAYFVSERDFNVSQLREYLGGKLPDYMIPAYFVKLEAMPLTPNGKVDRKSLDAHGTRLTTGIEYSPPGNEAEMVLSDIWKKVLKLDKIGIDDNFFDLGGSSMDVITLNDELKKTFKRNISVVAIFRYLTIRSFARYLTREEEQAGTFEKKVTRADEIEKCRERVKERMKHPDEIEPRTGETGLEIAVIGMDGRFPGSKNIDEFWENLKNGRDCITFYSDKELEEAGVSSELLQDPNYVKAQPHLENIEYFDSSFFDYTPKEAEVMDPQMRVFHECVYHALEDAGYDPYSYEKLIGLYAGASVNFYWLAFNFLAGGRDDAGLFEARQLFDKEYLCTRVAHKLNLRGPAVSVQTSCSTSLVAIHMACQGLIGGECDTALAGGVSIPYLKKEGHLFQEGSIFSSDGHCKVFDARADGTIFGNGVGVVVLKRLKDAIADRDHIYAVIKGSFINNDGLNRGGYTAPNAEGEAAVIHTALQIAQVTPESIGYVETHSTGTALGGPIEIEGLNIAFNTGKKGFCALGCVKTNLGHLNMAAGAAAFIKTVLVLKNRLIPPTLHFATPDPAIDFENSAFYVNTKLSPWENNHYPRRAGVNSFGIGGTNAHVVLEEYKDASGGQGALFKETFHNLILLSAKTQSALDQMTRNLAEYLKKNRDIGPGDAAYTLAVGRRACVHRRMLVCAHVDEAIDKLTSAGTGKMKSFAARKERRPVIFMFSGLGSQYVDMGKDLYQKEPLFRAELDRCFEILDPLGFDIKEILYPASVAKNLPDINQFEIAQLAVFIFEYALAKLLMEWGILPHAMIGYSFGEYTAACTAGVLSLQDALKLVILRGELINRIPAGAMLSVPLPWDQLKPLLARHPGLSLAIDNGPSCITAGPKEAMAAFEEEMKNKRHISIRIPSARALHSPMMKPILEEFTEKIVREITVNEPRIPYISNVTGGWITSGDITDPNYWAKHLARTVRFSDGIKELMKQENAIFVEIGPGRDLSTLLVRHIEDKPGFDSINLTRHPEHNLSDNCVLLKRIGRLWLWGVQIDWNRFYAQQQKHRISLPTYPFEPRAFPVEVNLSEKATEIFSRHFLPLTGKPESPVKDVDVKEITTPPDRAGKQKKGRPELETQYVNPRDELEQRMTRTWSHFFGFEPIGIDDDFFELGGDSLKVLIIIKKIYEESGVELFIDEFFKGRTIRNLASLIRDKARSKYPLFNLFGDITPTARIQKDLKELIQQPVGLLNDNTDSFSQKKLFCFPPALAYGRVYKTLSNLIKGYSFYSFNFIEGEDRLMRYVEIITGFQPEGPYILFEYSAGAKLTFEVAKALEKIGFEVSDIILMDSFWPGEPMGAEVPEAVIKNLEEYLEGLGVEVFKEEVIGKVRKYRRYFTQQTRPEKVKANLHLIVSEENKDTPQARCWDQFTATISKTYQGFGQHDDMLSPGLVEKNAVIIREVLDRIVKE